jgi:hypothetical protein
MSVLKAEGMRLAGSSWRVPCRIRAECIFLSGIIIIGALAQMGERLPCTQEVKGSIPLGSTSFIEPPRLTP